MEPESHRLEQRQTESTAAFDQSLQRTNTREFGSVEEVLREDRAQTPPPTALAHRVAEGIRQAGPPPRPWWARWLGRRDDA